MKVEIVTFPQTKVAVVEHLGPSAFEYQTARKLINWKLEMGFRDQLKYRSYGVHFTDPRTTPPDEHRVDFCLSVEHDVGPNDHGILNKIIPEARCARARDIGSRYDNQAALYLYKEWLPNSGESPGGFPIFFHYVNVGPDVLPKEMITDVYLPLR